MDVAAAMAFDHDGDCGIYNVGTLEAYRRRGIATALTALQLRYVGFRDLARYLEFTPS